VNRRLSGVKDGDYWFLSVIGNGCRVVLARLVEYSYESCTMRPDEVMIDGKTIVVVPTIGVIVLVVSNRRFRDVECRRSHHLLPTLIMTVPSHLSTSFSDFRTRPNTFTASCRRIW
jgi:hypothetical protein